MGKIRVYNLDHIFGSAPTAHYCLTCLHLAYQSGDSLLDKLQYHNPLVESSAASAGLSRLRVWYMPLPQAGCTGCQAWLSVSP